MKYIFNSIRLLVFLATCICASPAAIMDVWKHRMKKTEYNPDYIPNLPTKIVLLSIGSIILVLSQVYLGATLLAYAIEVVLGAWLIDWYCKYVVRQVFMKMKNGHGGFPYRETIYFSKLIHVIEGMENNRYLDTLRVLWELAVAVDRVMILHLTRYINEGVEMVSLWAKYHIGDRLRDRKQEGKFPDGESIMALATIGNYHYRGPMIGDIRYKDRSYMFDIDGRSYYREGFVGYSWTPSIEMPPHGHFYLLGRGQSSICMIGKVVNLSMMHRSKGSDDWEVLDQEEAVVTHIRSMFMGCVLSIHVQSMLSLYPASFSAMRIPSRRGTG